jgi:hypothetical protein
VALLAALHRRLLCRPCCCTQPFPRFGLRDLDVRVLLTRRAATTPPWSFCCCTFSLPLTRSVQHSQQAFHRHPRSAAPHHPQDQGRIDARSSMQLHATNSRQGGERNQIHRCTIKTLHRVAFRQLSAFPWCHLGPLPVRLNSMRSRASLQAVSSSHGTTSARRVPLRTTQ